MVVAAPKHRTGLPVRLVKSPQILHRPQKPGPLPGFLHFNRFSVGCISPRFFKYKFLCLTN